MVTLRDVMTGDPMTTTADATVAEAAAMMVQARVGSLLVEVDGSMAGIFTERDVLRAAGTEGDLLRTRVHDWMTPDPTTADADDDSAEAIEVMLASGFRHLPVSDEGDIVGVVSLRDLLTVRSARRAPHVAPVQRDVSEAADPTPASTPAQVHDRRERMFEATRRLRQSSRPPEGDVDAWRRELHEAAEEIAEVVAAHIAGTEQEQGFFDELVRESGGRLQAAVRRLRRDHERSTQLVERLRAGLRAEDEPEALTQMADELFAQLEAHRHRGADLLWQAHGVEIGGGD